MMPGDSSSLQSVDPAMLTAIVRQSLRRDAFQVVDWKVSRLGGGAGNPVSVGLYRFEGVGLDGVEPVAWSVILKIVQSPANVGWENMGEGADQTHWNYWKRELLVYPSGLLETLPQGMAAPRCFNISERPGNIAWLWLEDITDSLDGVWPLERYALAARHLGRLNGLYSTEQPLPAYPWLSRNLIQQWVVHLQPLWQSLPWEDPRVLARYPRGNSFHRLLLENERFQSEFERLPRALCHGDTYPTNFMSRVLADGQEQTIALDWALVNIGRIGDDLGQLVFGAHMNLKEPRREEITRILFDSYMDGLRESGCRVDPQRVRLGFTASAALRVGLFQVLFLSEELKQNPSAAQEITEPSGAPDCFEVMMANEAYQVLESLG